MLSPFDHRMVGPNLRIEPIHKVAKNLLKQAALDLDIFQFSGRKWSTDFEGCYTKAMKEWQNQRQFCYVVQQNNNSRYAVVGMSSYYEYDVEHRQIKIGFTWYHPSVWGTAVNPECKWLMLDFAFRVLKLVRVGFEVDARNQRSLGAMVRLGAVKEGVLRKHKILFDGYIRDTVSFGIVDDDWPSISDQLQKRFEV